MILMGMIMICGGRVDALQAEIDYVHFGKFRKIFRYEKFVYTFRSNSNTSNNTNTTKTTTGI